jgi:hypothetical protein
VSDVQPAQDNDAGLDREYVYRRLAIRRRMAVSAFIQWIAGNSVLIGACLSFDSVAQRASQVGTIIATWEMACMGIVGWYWGVGAYEHSSFFSGNSYASFGGQQRPPAQEQPQKTSRAD